jgi:hypothetical protein
MKTESNYQDLLKIFALITMVIDHLGLYFFPECDIMRLIGRSAMPIFCFFAGYNYKHKPSTSVLILGILLYLITTILFEQFTTTNILISIYIGQCYLYLFQNKLKNFFTGYLHVIILGVIWPFTWFFVDYGSLVIAIMILGYIAKHDKPNLKIAIGISIILSVFHTVTIFNFSPIYILMVIVLAIIEYLFMTLMNFNQPIGININIISRNMLFIYFAHLALIQILWFYHIINWW